MIRFSPSPAEKTETKMATPLRTRMSFMHSGNPTGKTSSRNGNSMVRLPIYSSLQSPLQPVLRSMIAASKQAGTLKAAIGRKCGKLIMRGWLTKDRCSPNVPRRWDFGPSNSEPSKSEATMPCMILFCLKNRSSDEDRSSQKNIVSQQIHRPTSPNYPQTARGMTRLVRLTPVANPVWLVFPFHPPILPLHSQACERSTHCKSHDQDD